MPNTTSGLKDILQYGQMGLALATLIVGAGLFTTAIKQRNLSDSTVLIVKYFGTLMLVLFALSFSGEMIKMYIEYELERFPPNPQINATVELPPLNKGNYGDYGPILISITDFSGTNDQETELPADHARTFTLHDRSQVRIDLGNLTSKLTQSRNLVSTTLTDTLKKQNPSSLGADVAQ